MRLILLGPPGVGKGAQAKRLKEYFNIIHLSTGDILRGEIESDSAIGREAQSFMDAGKLVPDNILLKIILFINYCCNRVSKNHTSNVAMVFIIMKYMESLVLVGLELTIRICVCGFQGFAQTH